ncbi:hypothetical protein JNB62_00925 [Microbacterium jejuense]|uniref:Uncharacterized protein n=1 Tax=Microbacterium jejuense TaxID=1263637 RepID=A0ABS7HHL8_9MICO|nr:hypothetical protein [Microbacterium jejuense]MBW9092240.1 hypothetical protein [Microbacterium jejuense]
MTTPSHEDRPERPRDQAGHENDSGQQPDHEAVGVGVIHGPAAPGTGEPPEAAGSAAEPTTGAAGDALDQDQERRLPTMAEDDAEGLEKVTGIVAQTRQDSGTEPLDRIVEVLRDRLQQAGVELPDGDIEELARQVSTGDAPDDGADGQG